MTRFALTLVVASLFAFSVHPAAAQPGAQPAKVYAIHGIPGGDLGLDPSLPVDIAVNGGCVGALTNFRFGDIRGPLALPAGQYTFEIKLNLGGAPCSGPTVITAPMVPFASGETATVIAHFDESGGLGGITASKFVNDVTKTGPGRARIAAHHTAAAPAVDVVVSRDIEDPTAPAITVPDFVNGQQVAAPIRPGDWQAALKLAGTNTVALGPATLTLKPFTAYFVYAVGSASTGSLTFLVNAVSNLK